MKKLGPLRLSIGIALILSVPSIDAIALPRDKTVREQFVRQTKKPPKCGHGKCVVDHKRALMNGGTDSIQNMQWVTEGEHKVKTRQDIHECKSSYTCKNKRLRKKLPWS